MNRDLRDPKLLGMYLLNTAKACDDGHLTLGEVYDQFRDSLGATPDYSSNLGPIEKYGRPQDLPSTLPN